MARPWLSVIMPTYNGAAYLGAALASIAAQGADDIEILAVDDGSSDDTRVILEAHAGRLPLRIVQRGRTGSWVANSNHALALARADHVCFLHQDDLWLNGRLLVLKRLLGRCPQAALLLHPSWFIGADGRRLGLWRCPLPSGAGALEPAVLVEHLLVQNFIAMPAPLFPRGLALQLGGLDERLWFTADWDLWLKLARSGPTLYYPRALAAFRIHAESQSVTRTARAGDLRHQLETVLRRHLSAWEALHPDRPEVGKAARLSLEVTMSLAAFAHGQRPDWARLGRSLLPLGPAGWHRFLRDSRIVERVRARLRLGKAVLSRPGGQRSKLVEVA